MRVLVAALAAPGLRRLLFGYLANCIGLWAATILIAIYAYGEGGATAVGVAVLVRMLPAGLAAPSLALLADRHSRRAVLLASAGAQAVTLALVAAAILADAPFGLVLALAALFTIAGTPYKPAQAALVPQLARTPVEAGAGNTALGGVDYAGFLAGSVVAGALAGTAGLATAIGLCTLPFLAAALALARLPRDQRPEPLAADADAGRLAELSAGLRTVWANPEMRLLTGVFAAETVVQSVVDVLVVVAAIELLGMGATGVGWLNAAWGVGGLAGAVVALSLLGRGRLASGVAWGCVLAGVPLSVIGVWHVPAAAVVLLVVLGSGYALLEAALVTLTQRLAADDVLARVFGVQETVFVVGTALGGGLAGAVIALLGTSTTLVVTGLVLPLMVLVLRRRLGRLEAGAPVPQRPYVLLRQLEMFAPLPICLIEDLAMRSETHELPVGTQIIRQGDQGDRFWVIDEGALDVSVDGHYMNTRGPGECVGEIALLRSLPRTATVVCSTATRLVSLDRADFLAGVGAHALSTRAAERLADERLANPVPATDSSAGGQ